VVLMQRFVGFDVISRLVSTRTYPLRSSFRPSYNMAVNLIRSYDREEAEHLVNSSFGQFQTDRHVVTLERNKEQLEGYLASYHDRMACHLGDVGEYRDLLQRLERMEQRHQGGRRRERGARIEAAMSSLRPGDVFVVPEQPGEGIPVTYVPARNTVFLAVAMGWAEVLDAGHIYIGVNAVDFSGYPDCRPAFVAAFQALAEVATKQATEGRAPRIQAPLMHLGKAEIIRLGLELGVDYGLTVSCYQADGEGRACGRCDACRFRREGFRQAGIDDPTAYYSIGAG
jgi:7-cyano-7-deazaguanine synthase